MDSVYWRCPPAFPHAPAAPPHHRSTSPDRAFHTERADTRHRAAHAACSGRNGGWWRTRFDDDAGPDTSTARPRSAGGGSRRAPATGPGPPRHLPPTPSATDGKLRRGSHRTGTRETGEG